MLPITVCNCKQFLFINNINGFRDLDSEKRAITKVWVKREKQIERVIQNIAGMHGDLEGIAGPSLPGIKVLELPSEETKI